MSMPETGPTGATRSPRIAAVELMRVFGCVGVCMFHAGAPWPRHLLPGSEMFMALTVAFATRAMNKRGIGGLVRSRFMSLIVTWLIWCAIYGAYRSFSGWRHGDGPFSWVTSIHQVWWGPLMQLWFPPFAFLATVTACSTSAAMRALGLAGGFMPFAIAAGALMFPAAAAWVYWGGDMVHPYEHWIRMLPAAAMGVAMSQIPQGTRESRRPAAAVWAIVFSAALAATLIGWSDVPSRYFATCTYVCAAWCIPIVAPRWLLFVSQLTFGVYLCHMGMFYVYYSVEARIGLPGNPWVLGGAATLASFCLVPFLRYTRLRWLVGVWGGAAPAVPRGPGGAPSLFGASGAPRLQAAVVVSREEPTPAPRGG